MLPLNKLAREESEIYDESRSSQQSTTKEYTKSFTLEEGEPTPEKDIFQQLQWSTKKTRHPE